MNYFSLTGKSPMLVGQYPGLCVFDVSKFNKKKWSKETILGDLWIKYTKLIDPKLIPRYHALKLRFSCTKIIFLNIKLISMKVNEIIK